MAFFTMRQFFYFLFFIISPHLAFASYVAPVIDDAHFFSSEETQQMTRALEDLRKQQGLWMVVHTSTEQNLNIEALAEQKFRQWKIGEMGRDNGLLLVLIPATKKMRLEVGYGLEGVFPDIVALHLLDDFLRPSLRANKAADGVLKVVQKISSIANGTEKEWLQKISTQSPFAELAFIFISLTSSTLLIVSITALQKSFRKTFAELVKIADDRSTESLSDVSQPNISWIIYLSLIPTWLAGFALAKITPTHHHFLIESLIGFMLGFFAYIPGMIVAQIFIKKYFKKVDARLDSMLSGEALNRVLSRRSEIERQRTQSSGGSGSSGKSGGSMGGGGRSGGGGASSSW